MASISKKRDKYQALVRRKGHRALCKTFTTKKAAEAWARQTESEMDRQVFRDYLEAQRTTLVEVLQRYQTEILPAKKSRRQVRSQIKIVSEALGGHLLFHLTPKVLADYRDHRLTTVSSQTTRHELSLIQRVLNHCIRDWGIDLPHGNPVAVTRLPPQGKGRDRRPTPKELENLQADSTIGAYVTLAIHTGLRRGEIASIQDSDVLLGTEEALLKVPESKNGESRTIPLVKPALEALRAILSTKTGRVKNAPDSITQAFSRACERYGIEGLRFHDLRHEATSRLFEMGLNPVEVASITGHKDTRILLRYTHIAPRHLLDKLNSAL